MRKELAGARKSRCLDSPLGYSKIEKQNKKHKDNSITKLNVKQMKRNINKKSKNQNLKKRLITKLTARVGRHRRMHHIERTLMGGHTEMSVMMSVRRRTLAGRLQIRHRSRGRRMRDAGWVSIAAAGVRVERHLEGVGGGEGGRRVRCRCCV